MTGYYAWHGLGSIEEEAFEDCTDDDNAIEQFRLYACQGPNPCTLWHREGGYTRLVAYYDPSRCVREIR